MRRRQKVVAEATGFVICRRHGPAMPAPQARHEAHPLPSCLRFFPSDGLEREQLACSRFFFGGESFRKRTFSSPQSTYPVLEFYTCRLRSIELS